MCACCGIDQALSASFFSDSLLRTSVGALLIRLDEGILAHHES